MDVINLSNWVQSTDLRPVPGIAAVLLAMTLDSEILQYPIDRYALQTCEKLQAQ